MASTRKIPYSLPTRYKCTICTLPTPHSSRICKKCAENTFARPVKRRRAKKQGDR